MRKKEGGKGEREAGSEEGREGKRKLLCRVNEPPIKTCHFNSKHIKKRRVVLYSVHNVI